MKLKSQTGAVIDASEAHAEVLLKAGWTRLEEPKPAKPAPKPAPKPRRTAKPKE